MNRFANVIEKVFLIFMIFVIAVCLICDNRVYYMYQNNAAIPNICGFVLLSLVAFLWNRYGKKLCTRESEKTVRRVLGIATVLLFAFQVYYAFQIYFRTGWDCKEIVDMATDIAVSDAKIRDEHYYSLYPNNVYLTSLFAMILKIALWLRVPNPYFALVVVGCLMVSLAGYYMGKCIFLLTNRSHLTYYYWGVFVLLTGLSPWISIPYSDTYTIIFPIFILWLYLSPKWKHEFFRWFHITLLTMLGCTIKPTVIIAGIAVSFWSLVTFLFQKKKSLKKVCLTIAGIALGIALADSFRYISYRALEFTPNDAKRMTVMHYLNMGANKESGGGYNQTDVNISYSYSSAEERNIENLESAINRYLDMGPVGFAVFETQKCLTNFNDGTFAWGHEGDFYWAHVPRSNAGAKFLRSFAHHDGDNFKVFVSVTQVLWMSVLWTFLLFFFKESSYRKTKRFSDTRYISVMLCVLGIMIFLMIFEARARYLYLYSPVFYLCGALGMERFLEKKEDDESNSN